MGPTEPTDQDALRSMLASIRDEVTNDIEHDRQKNEAGMAAGAAMPALSIGELVAVQLNTRS